MSAHGIAWVIAGTAAVFALFAVFLLTRGVSSAVIRNTIRVLLAVVLLVPAPVPGYPHAYAPAFVVIAFEALLQSDGRAEQAIWYLSGAALAAMSVLALVYGVLHWRDREDSS